jgi:hypothetical protein
LLLALLIGVSILVVPSIGILLYVAKSHPVYADSLSRLESDERVRRTLGTPLRPSLWTYARIVRGSGTWRFSVTGSLREAAVVVSARHQDQGWALQYVLVKPAGDARGFSLPLRDAKVAADGR